MKLYKGRWYALARYSGAIHGEAFVGQFHGLRQGKAAFYFKDGGSILFRSMQVVETDSIIAEVPDPRLVIKVSKFIGRNLLGLDYVN